MDLEKINEYADKSIIANEDSLEFMKSLLDNSVDLVVSSPPYNVGKEYEDKATLDDYLAFQKKIISEIYRILKLTGMLLGKLVTTSITNILKISLGYLML